MTKPQLPEGFRFAGVACGIKESGKPDVSLIVVDNDSVAAGVYTTNQIVAAPVTISKSHTPSSKIRAVVTNSGNANACTGDEGMSNAVAMCEQVAELVGCQREQVLVMSTGVIGHQLPMDSVKTGIDDAYSSLSAELAGFNESAEAIRTTDKDRKIAFQQLRVDGKLIRIAAMAKGAGMIAPNMATMLAVVLTDAVITEETAQSIIASAADISFNQVSVDGHTSTNDTLLLIASGRGEPLHGEGLVAFTDAVNGVCIELGRKLVADGEGATHVMDLTITGAKSDTDASVIARSVAASPLVKTALTGGDPNWGRIVSAAGYADAVIDPQKTSLSICGTIIYQNGSPQEFDAADLSQLMKANVEVEIELIVGDGPGSARYWSSDLTTDYVTFNSEYTT